MSHQASTKACKSASRTSLTIYTSTQERALLFLHFNSRTQKIFILFVLLFACLTQFPRCSSPLSLYVNIFLDYNNSEPTREACSEALSQRHPVSMMSYTSSWVKSMNWVWDEFMNKNPRARSVDTTRRENTKKLSVPLSCVVHEGERNAFCGKILRYCIASESVFPQYSSYFRTKSFQDWEALRQTGKKKSEKESPQVGEKSEIEHFFTLFRAGVRLDGSSVISERALNYNLHENKQGVDEFEAGKFAVCCGKEKR